MAVVPVLIQTMILLDMVEGQDMAVDIVEDMAVDIAEGMVVDKKADSMVDNNLVDNSLADKDLDSTEVDSMDSVDNSWAGKDLGNMDLVDNKDSVDTAVDNMVNIVVDNIVEVDSTRVDYNNLPLRKLFRAVWAYISWE